LQLTKRAHDLRLVLVSTLANDWLALDENVSNSGFLQREHQLIQERIRFAPGHTGVVQVDRHEISRLPDSQFADRQTETARTFFR
jgi:hypothetical protein